MEGKFKIIENNDDSCDYIIYFRLAPIYKFSISGIDSYYHNNIKLYYDGIIHNNGDLLKTFEFSDIENHVVEQYFESFKNITSNIQYEDTILTQYGLFKCDMTCDEINYGIYLINLRYKNAYMLNIIKDSLTISDENLSFIIDGKTYNYNGIIPIDKDSDINKVMTDAQIKYYGNILDYDYIFYIENSTINVEIKNTKDNYKTFKFNSITGVPKQRVDNINLYVYGHSLKITDSIKLFCDGGYIPICNLTATHINNRFYHFVYSYDDIEDIVNIDLVYNKLTELPIFETYLDNFVGTYKITLISDSNTEIECMCDISSDSSDSDYETTFNAKFYDYTISEFPNAPTETNIIFTYDGEYITSDYITSQNDNTYYMNMILSYYGELSLLNYKLYKINTIKINENGLVENGFKDNTMILNGEEFSIKEITKQVEGDNSTGPTTIPGAKPFPFT